MKKLFAIFILILISSPACLADNDFYQLYEQAELSSVKLMHNIDPYQDEENQRYTWSPYPLFRTSSPLYFKNITIEPGYYIVTPRTFKNKDYILFKENGKVTHMVPVAKKTITPPMYYETKVPVPKETGWQKFCKKTKNLFFKAAKDSKKTPPPSAYIETHDEGAFFLVKYYYGTHCYWLLFKKHKY